MYTVGHFLGTADFDPGAGTFNLTSGADVSDVFISKLDSAGNFVWAGQLGGTAIGQPPWAWPWTRAATLYAVGLFSGTADFDPGPSIHYFVAAPGPFADGFVPKLGDSSSGAAGAVPDGALVPGLPLTIAKAGGTLLDLDWNSSCVGSDVDYEVYEGLLGDFTTHMPRLCSTSGATGATLAPSARAATISWSRTTAASKARTEEQRGRRALAEQPVVQAAVPQLSLVSRLNLRRRWP